MKARAVMVVLAGCLAFMAASPAWAGPDEVARARQSLDDVGTQRGIQCAVHCEGLLVGADFEDSASEDERFALLYNYHWKSLGIFNNSTELVFVFDSGGKLLDIVVRSDSSRFPAFLTADGFLAFVKDRLRRDPDMNKLPDWARGQLLRLIDSADGKSVMKFLYNWHLL